MAVKGLSGFVATIRQIEARALKVIFHFDVCSDESNVVRDKHCRHAARVWKLMDYCVAISVQYGSLHKMTCCFIV